MNDSEFDAKYGQRCVPVRHGKHGYGSVVTVAGPELTIETHGKVYTFEWHSHCGPIPLNKQGQPKDLRPKDPFWEAVTHWDRQGKRLDETRRAIWETPAPEDLSDYVRVGRNLVPKATHERLSAKLEAKKKRRKSARQPSHQSSPTGDAEP